MYFCQERHMKINIVFWGCFTEDNDNCLLPLTSHPIILRSIVVGCLFASIVLDTNEGPDNNSQYWVNTMRDSFTCNPRFSGFCHLATSHIVIVLDSLFAD
jgi:hypothetical protein